MEIKEHTEEVEKQIIARYKGENDNYCVTATLEMQDFLYCQFISSHVRVENKVTKYVDSGVSYADIMEEDEDICKSKFVNHVCGLEKRYGVDMVSAY